MILNRLSHQPVFWIVLTLIAAVLFAAAGAADSPGDTYRWTNVQEIGRTEGLKSAELLLTTQHNGIIWDASGLDAPLVYSPLDEIGDPQSLLPYPGIAPHLWSTAPAAADTYHLIWLDQNGQLYNVVLDSEGQTVRGPIDLSPEASSFIALPYGSDHVFTAWISDNRLFATTIDQVGRSRPLSNPLREPVVSITGAADRESKMHLAWLESNSAGNWTINHVTTSPDIIELEPFQTLLTIQTNPGEIITSFTMGLDQSSGYLFWGLTSAVQPDVERVYSLSFPLDRPTDVQLTELALPTEFDPDGQLPPSEFAIGPVAALASGSGSRAALRWPRAAYGQHAIFPLAITLNTGDMWVPAVVYFQSGVVLGYQVVASLPANAAPPTLVFDPAGDLHLAWAGLRGTIPTLFTASTDGRGLIREPD